MKPYNRKNIPLAKSLRKNMTKEERHLWYDFLRKHPVRFQRQKAIGKYIVDFYCASAGVAIELDGSQHFEPEELKKDFLRTKALEKMGIQVVRIPNNEIWKNFCGVCEYIDSLVTTPPSAELTPPLQGEACGCGEKR